MTILPELPVLPAAAPTRAAEWRSRVMAPRVVAGAVLLGVLAAAVAPGLLAPGDPLAVHPVDAFSAPSLAHPFGTDDSGRDLYTRVVHGASASLLIGVAATLIGTLLGLVLGIAAGVGTRLTDAAVSRVLEVLFALPGLLLALVIIAFAGPGPIPATLAVGLATAPGYARIFRTRIRAVRSSEMVEAARVLGRGPLTLLVRHVLPNALAPVVVLATLGVGQAIVWASSLSYLGLGSPPPAPEWGAMLEAGRTYLQIAPWMTVFPGLAIVATAAATTVVGRAFAGAGRR
ncbi:ABC transporter permease [Frondihabitans sp. Leaf304]|uniref:ABC transporter permease n=1 Tax=Frondihabitans sp. Leaf304 TaxID=1736329 RepID=UPI000A036DE9|nr:ABC transporter permease [Frondihabitans sp. Leaf304]